MRVLGLVLTILLALPAAASEIVGGLSQNRVSLTANYSGTEILIFGAIRHEAPRLEDEAPFDVVIVVEGPREPAVVWRKERRLGIWVNVESVSLASVPSFLAVASTAPLHEILSPEADAEFRISPQQAIRAEQAIGAVPDPGSFSQALLRIREREEQYLTLTRWVTLDRNVLFRVTVPLPANLSEGAYTTRMFLLRDGQVISQYRNAIIVRKEGLERWLHQLAYDQPFLYGLLALVLALIAGWGASAAFRLVRH